MNKIRIVLVDDHSMFRSGIRVLLSLYPDFDVVGEASDGQEALDVVRELLPDVVIMDIATDPSKPTWMPVVLLLKSLPVISDVVPAPK